MSVVRQSRGEIARDKHCISLRPQLCLRDSEVREVAAGRRHEASGRSLLSGYVNRMIISSTSDGGPLSRSLALFGGSMRLTTLKQQRAVDDFVRVAGSEKVFKDTLQSFSRTPSAREVLLRLIEHRLERSRLVKEARLGAAAMTRTP